MQVDPGTEIPRTHNRGQLGFLQRTQELGKGISALCLRILSPASNTAAISPTGPFTFQSIKIKYNEKIEYKGKNSIPQSHEPHFQRSVAPYVLWSPYRIADLAPPPLLRSLWDKLGLGVFPSLTFRRLGACHLHFQLR